MKFEIFKLRKNKKYYFTLKARNGRIILSSQGYTSLSSCINGIESAKKNGGNTDHFIRKKSPREYTTDPVSFKRKKSSNSLHSFHLLAPNGEPIGHSQSYTTKAAMEKGIRFVMANAPHAILVDLTGDDIKKRL